MELAGCGAFRISSGFFRDMMRLRCLREISRRRSDDLWNAVRETITPEVAYGNNGGSTHPLGRMIGDFFRQLSRASAETFTLK